MKFIFFAVESSAVTFTSSLVIAMGIDGKPAPAPMSKSAEFWGISLMPASESAMCFIAKSFSSVIAVRLKALFFSTTISK